MFSDIDRTGWDERHFRPFQERRPVGPNRSCVIYIFTPKTISDTCRRPYMYHFDNGYREAVVDLVDKARMGIGYNQGDNFMRTERSRFGAITPAADGQLVELSRYSDCHTFIMIVDKQMGGDRIVTGFNSKLIYSGVIHGEPMVQSATLGRLVPNERAILTITHHTKLVDEMMGARNNHRDVYVEHDVDLIPVVETSQLSRYNNLTDMRPGSVMAAAPSFLTPEERASRNPDEEYAAPISLAEEIHGDSDVVSVATSTSINNPVNHLEHITSALVDSALTGTNAEDLWADKLQTLHNGCMFASNFGTNLNSTSITPMKVQGDLDPVKNYSMAELDRMYPDLKAIYVEQPRQLGFEVADVMDPSTPRNIVGSILADCLPTTLVNSKLADACFAYSSWKSSPENSRRGYIGSLDIQDASPIVAMDEVEYNNAVDSFRQTLLRDIFPMILAQDIGDIEVFVACSVAGTSQIDVNLLDFNESYQDKGYINRNNSLGGFNSPMVGTFNDGIANQVQLTGLRDSVGIRNGFI